MDVVLCGTATAVAVCGGVFCVGCAVCHCVCPEQQTKCFPCVWAPTNNTNKQQTSTLWETTAPKVKITAFAQQQTSAQETTTLTNRNHKRKNLMKEDALPNTSDQILDKSTKGATFLMMGQLSTKLITFILNNLLVRLLSPRIFGITSFLEFICSTVLFFSREAIRVSTLRINNNNNNHSDATTTTTHDDTLQKAVNLAHVPLYIGIPLSIVLTTWQYKNINHYFILLPFFNWSIALIWLSIVLELFTEPFFVVNQLLLNYSTRSKLESFSITMGCIVNFMVVYAFDQNWFNITLLDSDLEREKEGIAILAFAIGKFCHSLLLLLCYLYDYYRNYYNKNIFNLSLTKLKKRDKYSDEETVTKSTAHYYYFDSIVFEHFKKVYFQLCFKHLLTEGDKSIINSLCTVEEQGIYSLLSNYGSLVTRLLFAPIEESLRLFLARLLVNQKSQNLKLSIQVLANLTKFYLYLSLLIIVFGPINSSFILQFLIGSKWSTTSVLHTIRIYCFYLPFLALNGIFEAFFQSVATGDQILRHSYFMMAFSGVFLVSCWLLIEFFKLSIDGLIISNIINMILRISFCGLFITNFYKNLHNNKSSFIFHFQNLKLITFIATIILIINWLFIGVVKNFKQFATNVVFAVFMLSLILLQERLEIERFFKRTKLEEEKKV